LNNISAFLFIAVRLKSTRLPKKALADIAGKPMLLRLIERQLECFSHEQLVVCTSTHAQDDPLEILAYKAGVHCFRGDKLDVMKRFIGAADRYGAETIARITGDNPLTDPVMLQHMFNEHITANAEYSYNDDLPIGTRAEVINVDSLRRIHQELSNPTYSEYMTFMLKRPDKLKTLEIKALDPRTKREELSVTVDTPRDIELVRAIYKQFNGKLPSLVEIIDWLDSVPDQKIMTGSQSSLLPEELDCSYHDDVTSY